MEDKSDKIIGTGIFIVALSIIILKFTGVIKISWAVLLSPIWILFLAGSLTAAIFIAFAIIKGLIDEYKEKKDERY